MSCPQLLEFLTGMEGIGKQQQTFAGRWIFGSENARLTSAIGMATQENAGNSQTPELIGRFTQAFPVFGRLRGERRPGALFVAEGKVAAINHKASRRKGGSSLDQERTLTVAAGAVGEYEAFVRGLGGSMQKTADQTARGGKRFPAHALFPEIRDQDALIWLKDHF